MGLHFNTYRYYAPEIGRFITPDPLGWAGNPKTATHITYQGIDAETGKPYVGYASKQGRQAAQEILKYRYGNGFGRFGGKPPEVIYEGYSQAGKDTARGLEQRRFENLGGLEGTANKQNPVGPNNTRRTDYLAAADEHLGQTTKRNGKGGSRC